jgi:hypothetical protein
MIMGGGGLTLFGAHKASKGEFELDKSIEVGNLKVRVSMDQTDPLIFSVEQKS